MPLGNVTDDADEQSPATDVHLADTEFYRKLAAVLLAGLHLAPLAYDAGDTRAPVRFQIAVMQHGVRFSHQHLDVLPDHLGTGIAKHLLGARAERVDNAAVVDRDDRVQHIVESSRQPRRQIPECQL